MFTRLFDSLPFIKMSYFACESCYILIISPFNSMNYCTPYHYTPIHSLYSTTVLHKTLVRLNTYVMNIVPEKRFKKFCSEASFSSPWINTKVSSCVKDSLVVIVINLYLISSIALNYKLAAQTTVDSQNRVGVSVKWTYLLSNCEKNKTGQST